MVYLPDPLNPEYGYCGYVGAPCASDFDCDYGESCPPIHSTELTAGFAGKCNNGKCGGFMGASCSAQLDCMGAIGTFFVDAAHILTVLLPCSLVRMQRWRLRGYRSQLQMVWQCTVLLQLVPIGSVRGRASGRHA